MAERRKHGEVAQTGSERRTDGGSDELGGDRSLWETTADGVRSLQAWRHDASGGLLRQLHATTFADRTEAIGRFARMGGRAVRHVEGALENETDPDRHWWLRAALQAIADAEARAKAPDKSLTTP